MCNAYNHSPSCRCGWGGEGHLGGGGWRGGSSTVISSFTTATSRSGGEASGGPRTYATHCWWCGEEVYYHTNGYGDSVLFDSLGWPWAVHACWEEYRRSLPRTSSPGGSPILTNYHDATAALTRAAPPASGHQHPVSLTGYVAKNHILWPLPSVIRLHTANQRVARWFRLDIAVGKVSYPFQIPKDIARRTKDQAIVDAHGQWLRWNDRWFLIATRLVVTTYPAGKQTTHTIMDIGDGASCHCCGVSIAKVAWGIDARRKVMCAACAERQLRVSSVPARQHHPAPAPSPRHSVEQWHSGRMACDANIGYHVRDDRDGARYPCRAIDTKPVSNFTALKKRVRAGESPRVRFQIAIRMGRAVVSHLEAV